MTSKFKVGDKFLRVADSTAFYTKGKTYTVKRVEDTKVFLTDNRAEHLGTHQWGESELLERFRLVEKVKPTKSQRITALENEVAELRPLKDTVSAMQERLEQLGVIVEKIRKPSTVVQDSLTTATSSVEDIIEFEGAQYKKVDRLAREGDVVIIKKLSHNYSAYIKTQKPYLVLPDVMIADKDSDGHKGTFNVYAPEYGRTPETVDVYELIVEDNPKVIAKGLMKLVNKSPNQLRAEIIEKAKVFVKEYSTGTQKVPKTKPCKFGPNWYLDKFEFVTNENKRTVVVLCKGCGGDIRERGIAKCMPGDVFNEHIGKAIALGRALGLDVSDFEGAVQPTEIVVGHVVFSKLNGLGGVALETDKENYSLVYARGNNLTIINDTNAIYGGVE